MQKFQIWYMKPEWFRDGICGAKPDPANLGASHVHLIEMIVPADGDERNPLERIYGAMQGEVWSPNGERRELIASKGLEHTSMSVGDVVIDEAGGKHIVASFGFEQLEEVK
jgi:hypothetical protein